MDMEMNLLLKDLCDRIPYNVKVYISGNNNIRTVKGIDLIVTDEGEWEYAITSYGSAPIELKYIKPYLRPISTMTQKEDEKWQLLKNGITESSDEKLNDKIGDLHDWLNRCHFDYRGLIDKGLAIEASEEMYRIEENPIW